MIATSITRFARIILSTFLFCTVSGCVTEPNGVSQTSTESSGYVVTSTSGAVIWIDSSHHPMTIETTGIAMSGKRGDRVLLWRAVDSMLIARNVVNGRVHEICKLETGNAITTAGWSQNGTVAALLVASEAHQRSGELVIARVTEGVIERTGVLGLVDGGVALSRDARQVAFVADGLDLVIYDVRDRTSRVVAELGEYAPEPFSAAGMLPRWDGPARRIALHVPHSGFSQVIRASTGASEIFDGYQPTWSVGSDTLLVINGPVVRLLDATNAFATISRYNAPVRFATVSWDERNTRLAGLVSAGYAGQLVEWNIGSARHTVIADNVLNFFP